MKYGMHAKIVIDSPASSFHGEWGTVVFCDPNCWTYPYEVVLDKETDGCASALDTSKHYTLPVSTDELLPQPLCK